MAQPGGGGAAGTATELAMGMAIAQQMIQQQGGVGQAPAGAALPEILTPADVAKVLHVSEEDVIASIEAGDLQGRKIGSAYRITRDALNTFLGK
jgi:excisionase family DNA binding protein